jgi:boron transporter
MAQGSQFPLRKPAGFHYDFFLLGITTFIAGLLGLPAPNGLIPQAPIHTQSLLIMGRPEKKRDDENPVGADNGGARSYHPSREGSRANSIIHDREPPPDPSSLLRHEVPVAVVEQRVSNLAQGALCLVLLTRPFLHVLHLIPRGVLAGLFWYMGADALRGNALTRTLLFFVRDRAMVPAEEPLLRVRPSRIALFVGIELFGFAATFAITQTIGMIIAPNNIVNFRPDVLLRSCNWVYHRDISPCADSNVHNPAPSLYRRGACYP